MEHAWKVYNVLLSVQETVKDSVYVGKAILTLEVSVLDVNRARSGHRRIRCVSFLAALMRK